MIHYLCPKCRAPLEAPEPKIGTTHPCPQCKFTVQVPLLAIQPANTGKTLMIIGISIGLAVVVFFMCIVVSLASIAIIGKNANSAFATVGSSVGAPVKPPGQ